MRLLAVTLLMALTLAACGHGGTITGTATYRERIALPPNAVFEARLEDVSRADVPAKLVNSVTIPDPGNPPIRFSIPFTGQQIDKRHQYSVRGAIRIDDRLVMATDRVSPVITRDMPYSVSLLLKAVPQPRTPANGEARREAPPLPNRFTTAPGLALPATYEGVLPCGDCPGTRWRLNLMPDQTFYLKMEYLERDGYFEDSGRWHIEPPGARLVLSGRGGTAERFAIDGNTLHKLDAGGQPMQVPNLNFTLARAGEFRWFDLENPMRGTYQPSPEGGTLTDCVSGHTYPVSGNIQMLAAAARGGPVTLDLKARITRPEGAPDALLMPLQILKLHPGEGCNRHRAAAPLTNTYWRLVELDGETVRVTEGRREPHMILRIEGNWFAATVGCNQIGGTYEVKDGTIRFFQARSTKMACPAPLSELESRFQRWLMHATTWRLNGQSLVITDAANASALFEAVYFD